MIIWGVEADKGDHDNHPTKYVQLTRKHILKMNIDKFKTKQASHFRRTSTSDGHKPENIKTQTFNKMPPSHLCERPPVFSRYSQLSQ